MQAKEIILTSVLLAGCQSYQQDVLPTKYHTQILYSAATAKKYITNNLDHSKKWPTDHYLAQKDLWNSIRDELKMKVPENSRIRDQKIKYLQNNNALYTVTLRAEPYMYWIVKQVKQRNMPMELALLPIVESAFNPHATSNADAAGLWQIIPQTGRNYGLKNNQWYDGRRDIVASTNVALDIMQHLNHIFNGDWLLTVAAYNSGEGRIMQAVKVNKRQGKPTNFWTLSLPRETSIYVPKILALSDIIKHSKQYGVKLPKTDENRALARIDFRKQMRLAQAAKSAGLSITRLEDYNPGYKKGITAPNGPHYIMIPKGYVAQLSNLLNKN
ncbi:membrane-bound lytic murein transglycosylase D [Serratia symbiotica str. 'Cinara cedri']|nr:membrane-bound lytic murein transglycosylase D [Serratia symbiotica str. 'Cinara cedri']